MCLKQQHVAYLGRSTSWVLVHTSTQAANVNQQGGFRVAVTQVSPHLFTPVAGVEPDCVHSPLPHFYSLCCALVLCKLSLHHSNSMKVIAVRHAASCAASEDVSGAAVRRSRGCAYDMRSLYDRMLLGYGID